MRSEPMTPGLIRQEFERDGCVARNGHFVYSGDKHGSVYIRKDILLSDTRRARRLIAELGRKIVRSGLHVRLEAVVGPAMSGIVMAHRTADVLDDLADAMGVAERVRAYYAEKEVGDQGEENFVLRRDFPLWIRGRNVLIAEDVVNDAHTARRVAAAVIANGGIVTGVVALWNRGPERKLVFPVPDTSRRVEIPIIALVEERLDAWEKSECPLCRDGVPFSVDLGHADKLSKPKA